MNKYEKFDTKELKEFQKALRTWISELDWHCQDNELATDLLEQVESELGERYNVEFDHVMDRI